MDNTTRSSPKLDWQLVAFWALAYFIAWSIAFVFGIDDETIRLTYPPILAVLIIYIPKFAFTISGLVIFLSTGRIKELWAQLFRFRVRWYWYLLAYLGPAGLYFLSALLTTQITGTESLSPVFKLPTSLWMLLFGAQTGIVTYFLFRGGLGEEIGLRGFALNRLQARHTPLTASLIIGFWWGLWHLPVWLGRSILEIAVTWLAVLAFSFIFTYFYNHTRSLPVVMLLHAALNSFDDVLETIYPVLKTMDWELIYLISILLIGIAVAFLLPRQEKKSKILN